MQNDVLARAVERPLAGRRVAAEEDVRRLIDACLAVVRRDGIDVKVSDIIRQAGLSNQAFYRHFESKDELLVAVMAEGRRALLAYLVRRMAAAGDPRAKVRRWVEGVLAQARNPEAAAATRPFAVNAGRLAHLFPDEVRASAEALKAPLVEALRAAGAPDPERDAEAVYVLAVGAMERHLVAGTRPSEADAAHLVEFAVKGTA